MAAHRIARSIIVRRMCSYSSPSFLIMRCTVFGQVGIGDDLIDWSGSCGNLLAAVGVFAIDEGSER